MSDPSKYETFLRRIKVQVRRPATDHDKARMAQGQTALLDKADELIAIGKRIKNAIRSRKEGLDTNEREIRKLVKSKTKMELVECEVVLDSRQGGVLFVRTLDDAHEVVKGPRPLSGAEREVFASMKAQPGFFDDPVGVNEALAKKLNLTDYLSDHPPMDLDELIANALDEADLPEDVKSAILALEEEDEAKEKKSKKKDEDKPKKEKGKGKKKNAPDLPPAPIPPAATTTASSEKLPEPGPAKAEKDDDGPPRPPRSTTKPSGPTTDVTVSGVDAHGNPVSETLTISDNPEIVYPTIEGEEPTDDAPPATDDETSAGETSEEDESEEDSEEPTIAPDMSPGWEQVASTVTTEEDDDTPPPDSAFDDSEPSDIIVPTLGDATTDDPNMVVTAPTTTVEFEEDDIPDDEDPVESDPTPPAPVETSDDTDALVDAADDADAADAAVSPVVAPEPIAEPDAPIAAEEPAPAVQASPEVTPASAPESKPEKTPAPAAKKKPGPKPGAKAAAKAAAAAASVPAAPPTSTTPASPPTPVELPKVDPPTPDVPATPPAAATPPTPTPAGPPAAEKTERNITNHFGMTPKLAENALKSFPTTAGGGPAGAPGEVIFTSTMIDQLEKATNGVKLPRILREGIPFVFLHLGETNVLLSRKLPGGDVAYWHPNIASVADEQINAFLAKKK